MSEHEDQTHPAHAGEEESTEPFEFVQVALQSRRFILLAGVALAFLGALYATLPSDKYTSTSRVIREDAGSGGPLPGGLSALGGLGGLGLSGMSEGLTPESYPAILKSRSVRLKVVRDSFYFASERRRMRYVDKVSQSGFLETIREAVLGMSEESDVWPKLDETARSDSTLMIVSKKEEEAIEKIRDVLSSSVDLQSGLMTVQVTLGSPELASSVNERFLYHLRERIREIRTEKARRTLAFVQQQFADAKRELREAEEDLASFLDANQNIRSAHLRNERERLERQVSFKSQLYSELQKQVTQTQLELRRSEPVITVVEKPVPPLKPSNPSVVLVVILSFMIGLVGGLGLVLIYVYGVNEGLTREQRRELQAKIRAYTPTRLYHWVINV